MDDCKLCGEPVPEDNAVEVEAAGMPEQTAVFHEVCWDNYESDFVQRERRCRCAALGTQTRAWQAMTLERCVPI
jgi:hypothetical protein